MANQTDIHLPGTLVDDEAPLNPLFKYLLSIIKSYKLFGKSPSFFIVYAHDNESSPDHPANSSVVSDCIGWFGEAGCSIVSDNTPPAALDITGCQFCLLPYWAYPQTSVEYVIVCGSQLLQEYMAHEKFPPFVEELALKYREIREKKEDERTLHAAIRKIQQVYAATMGHNFHHVLTEIALLKARADSAQKSSIIPFQLNGDHTDVFPEFITRGNDSLRTVLGNGPDQDGSKYKCFLEILEKLSKHEKEGTGSADLIRKMRAVYNDAVEHLRTKGSITPEECRGFEIQLHWWCREWIRTQPLLPAQIDVAEVRKALKEYTRGLSIRTVLDRELPIGKYQIELEISDPPPPPETKTISMTELFQAQTSREGMRYEPRRILIRGRPGAGKTTLCRQMLHYFEQTLGDGFRWVFWVPLRRFGQERDLATFLGKFYFNENYDMARGLHQRLFNQDRDHTLFILDGWDEILGASRDISQRVSELANFKHVIITSRFFSTDMPPLDQKVNATGLSYDAVAEFLSNPDITSPMIAINDIEAFLSRNQSTWEIFRMPMLLYLICSCWGRLKQQLMETEQPVSHPTVSMMYQSMVTELWRKDLAMFVNSPYSRDNAGLLSEYYLFDEIQAESDCLGTIALQLFERRAPAMDRKSIDKIAEAHEQRRKHKWLAPNVTRTSFLSLDQFSEKPVYTFVHLTFQEYFAAQYLVQNPSALRSNIRKYKYDPRFGMVFRFVAGLLQGSERDADLETFFGWVEAEPRDLLGPFHQRLVMDCLSQVQRPRLAELRDTLEYRLRNWLLFECSWLDEPQLVTETEFPDQVRRTVLDDSTVEEDIKLKILHSFKFKGEYSQAIMELTGPVLRGQASVALKKAYLETWTDDASLPPAVLQATEELLDNHETGLRETAINILAEQVELPRHIVDRFIELLHDESVTVKRTAIWVLGENSLPNAITKLHELILNDAEDAYVRATAVQALTKQDSLRPDIRENVMTRDSFAEVRYYIPHPRTEQGTWILSDEQLDQNHDNLSNSDCDIRRAAVDALGEQPTLQLDILQSIVRCLEDPEERVRHAACRALCTRQFLPLQIIWDIAGHLNTADGRIKLALITALGKRADLPIEIIQSLRPSLDDDDADIQAAAVQALAQQEHLTPEILAALQQRNLTPSPVTSLVPHFRSLNWSQINVLGQRTNLSEPIVLALAARLDDDEILIQLKAIEALGNQSSLSSRTLKLVAAKINNPNKLIRDSVASAINRFSDQAMRESLADVDPQFFNNLYRVWLWRSFSEPVAWSFDSENRLCENMVPLQPVDVDFDCIINAIRTGKRSLSPSTPVVSSRLE